LLMPPPLRSVDLSCAAATARTPVLPCSVGYRTDAGSAWVSSGVISTAG
jgi:hypothetical protein